MKYAKIKHRNWLYWRPIMLFIMTVLFLASKYEPFYNFLTFK
jgi:hypothetical protein